jgi:hypothetical protein
MHPKNDPTHLVDEWPLPSLSLADRKRIKAHLLSASALYKRGNPSDSRRFVAPIQQAFDGIASVLFDAKILTPEVLKKQLPLLLLESAIAAEWLHYVQPLSEISAEFFHAYPDVFSAEIDEWSAKLLERDAEENKSAEWSPLRRDFEAFKAMKKLMSGPRERIPEAFVRDSIARQYGIKPEEVTPLQINFEVAGMLRDYPAIELIPSEPASQTEDVAPIANESERQRMSATINCPNAARKMEAYLSANGIGVTQFATQAQTTDRTLRNFRKTGKVRRDILENIAKAMGISKESLLKD